MLDFFDDYDDRVPRKQGGLTVPVVRVAAVHHSVSELLWHDPSCMPIISANT